MERPTSRLKGKRMPIYPTKTFYTPDGLKGLHKEGAVKRRDEGASVATALGGAMLAFYGAFGDTDVFSIFDLPDDEAAAALSIAVNKAGSAKFTISTLLTAEQLDEAFSRTMRYRPPGR